MIWDEHKPTLEIAVRHVVFLSYYHWGDEHYRKKFEMSFIHMFVSKFLEPGEIEETSGEEYIQRLIDDRHISNSTIVVVLIGPNTWGRKNIDWEIAAALTEKDGSVSGLMGILLPEFEMAEDGKYSLGTVPPRLADNVKSGFAQIYTWDSVCSDDSKIRTVVQKTFDAAAKHADKVDNSRDLMDADLCE